jgi:hypothetical protein
MGAMSKSKKKQRARAAQARGDFDTALSPAVSETIAKPLVLDRVLYDRICDTVRAWGVSALEGGRLTHVYNGETLSIKYVAGDAADGRGERVMVEAFRQGIVFQMEDGQLLVQMSGAWVEQLLHGSETIE